VIHSSDKTSEPYSDTTAPVHSQFTPPGTPPFRFGPLLAILSGLLLWLAHPLAGLWPLAWVGLAPLIYAIQQSPSTRRAAGLGYLFGWAYLAPTWYWTGLTIVGWTGSQIGWVALFALTLLAALFYAAWAALAWRLTQSVQGAWRIVSIAAAWVLMEWLRSVGSLSVPWAQISYTQYKALPLIQISELTGAFGVSFLLVFINVSIIEWWRHRAEPLSRRWLLYSAGLIGATCLYGYVRMAQIPHGKTINVAMMQGNFNYNDRFGIYQQKLEVYDSLTRQAYLGSNPKPDLYVWAETSAPGDAFHDAASREAMQRLADRYNAAIFTGSLIGEDGAEYNSALLFTPGSRLPLRYDKQGVVPFGEYIPFRSLIPESIQKQFQFFETDLSPGKTLAPMHFETSSGTQVSLGPFICYESVYPHYTRTMTARGANLLVTPSHDTWFQSDAASEQHLAIVVFRAIENRRDVARSTTDGITAAIDATGRILERSKVRAAVFLVHPLQLRNLITLYTRFGDWFVGLCALLIVAALYRSYILKTPKSVSG